MARVQAARIRATSRYSTRPTTRRRARSRLPCRVEGPDGRASAWGRMPRWDRTRSWRRATRAWCTPAARWADPEAHEVEIEGIAPHRTEALREVVREEPALRLADGRIEIDPDVLVGSSAAELSHQAVGTAEVHHSTARRLEEQPLENEPRRTRARRSPARHRGADPGRRGAGRRTSVPVTVGQRTRRLRGKVGSPAGCPPPPDPSAQPPPRPQRS